MREHPEFDQISADDEGLLNVSFQFPAPWRVGANYSTVELCVTHDERGAYFGKYNYDNLLALKERKSAKFDAPQSYGFSRTISGKEKEVFNRLIDMALLAMQP